jgi:hypothetical protein
MLLAELLTALDELRDDEPGIDDGVELARLDLLEEVTAEEPILDVAPTTP